MTPTDGLPTRAWPATKSPTPVWLTSALLILVGLAVVGIAIFLVVGAVNFISYGSVFVNLGAFTLGMALIFAVVGVILILIGRALYRGSRVARIMAIYCTVSYTIAALLSGSRDAGLVISALVALTIAGVLTFNLAVREFYNRIELAQEDQPTPVLAAQTLLTAAAVLDVIIGILFFPLVVFSIYNVVWGLAIIALGTAYFQLSRQLKLGSRTARTIVLLLALVNVIILTVAGHSLPGAIIPVCWVLFVVGSLWIPTSSRDYFDGHSQPSIPVIATIDLAVDRFARTLGIGQSDPL